MQIFFLVSGFYMALVLAGKYRTKREFYVSRSLRIFVPYYAILLCIAVWSTISGFVFHDWLTLAPFTQHPLQSNGFAGFAFASLTNVTVFGQDWVMFLKDHVGEGLRLTAKLGGDDAALYRYLVIPQAWSIGIEETFYLLAPLLIALKSRALLVVLACSLAARLFVYHLGATESLWKYRLAAFEIALFVAGVLAYRAYVRFGVQRRVAAIPARLYPIALLALTAGFAVHAALVESLGAVIGTDYAYLLSYAGWAAFVPVLFAAFRNSRADRFIGDLCYPIYLLHFTVALSLKGYPQWGAATALVTVALAVLLCVCALRPYERWRHRYLRGLSERGDVKALRSTYA